MRTFVFNICQDYFKLSMDMKKKYLITFNTAASYEFFRHYLSQALTPKSSGYLNAVPKLANDMSC